MGCSYRPEMTSPRPYLIRGLYEWILDNGQTPYLLVNAEHENLVVPRQFVEEGRIVLNIRPEAVQNLGLGNSKVEFDARFGGKPMHVEVPVTAVLAIVILQRTPYEQQGKLLKIHSGDDHPKSTAAAEASGSSPVVER